MKRLLFVPVILAVFFVGGCGEKPCHKEGSLKAEKGKIYHCEDRGSGLLWYPE